MKKVAFIFTFFSLTFLLFNSAFAQDEKANTVLKTAKAKLEGMNDFTASFKYTLSGPNAKNASKSGKIKYKKGKFRVEMGDQELYCDKNKLWVFLKNDNEVNVTPYDANDGLDIEQIFKTYQQASKAKYEGDETVHNIACFKIYIASTSSKSDYNQVRLWINKNSHYLEKAELTDRRQVKTIYEFSNIKTNNGLSDNEFRFDVAKHPGVQVYDETN
ncbi:MAG: outer-membrane lipoprotein carrier protein LolA [Bacteroidia bacterium]|nr:outer-membrane lipoprotein carrier protein LolA [Bacteroidia bacterium]